MNTTNISSTNFRAKFINKIPIKKLNQKNRTYTDSVASFVQIDPNNIKDILALKDTSNYWYRARYAKEFYYRANYLFQNPSVRDLYQIYALTKQKHNFEDLKPELILGLAEVEDKLKKIEISYLEVDPNTAFNSPIRDYKYIGTGILNSLKKLYNKTIELESACSAIDFYKKNGFKKYGSSSCSFYWLSEK